MSPGPGACPGCRSRCRILYASSQTASGMPCRLCMPSTGTGHTWHMHPGVRMPLVMETQYGILAAADPLQVAAVAGASSAGTEHWACWTHPPCHSSSTATARGFHDPAAPGSGVALLLAPWRVNRSEEGMIEWEGDCLVRDRQRNENEGANRQ